MVSQRAWMTKQESGLGQILSKPSPFSYRPQYSGFDRAHGITVSLEPSSFGEYAHIFMARPLRQLVGMLSPDHNKGWIRIRIWSRHETHCMNRGSGFDSGFNTHTCQFHHNVFRAAYFLSH